MNIYKSHFYCGLNDLPNSKLSNVFIIRRWEMKGLVILLFIVGTFFLSGLLIAQDGIVNTFTNLSTPEYSRNPQRIVTIAVLQAGSNHYKTGNPGLKANFDLFTELARQVAASKPHPDLICFPEYAVSGWPYPHQEIINSLAESIPGNGHWYLRYKDLAREIGTPLLCWLVESENNKLYNTAFILGREGEFKGKYRKVHANLGEQTWWGWSQGKSFEVIELDSVRYGVSICADMFFPETVRCYELMGADAVLHLSIGDDMGHVIPVRAFDSKLPIVDAIFKGGSYAVDGEGKLLGKLSGEEAGWKSFQIYPFREYFGKKYGGIWDIKKGQQNVRNLAAYSILTDPSTRPSWAEIFMDDAGRHQTREQLLKRFHGCYDANDPSKSGRSLKSIDDNGIATVLMAQPQNKDHEGSANNFMSVAAVQMRSSGNLAENVDHINTFILDCAAKGARVVVFPEFALSGISEEVINNLTKEQIEHAEQIILETCRKASVFAIVGMPWRNGTKYYNSATVFSPEGGVIERYHKIQLAGEKWADPGDHLSVFKIDDIPCSIIICHDERYPELVRLPVLAGAKVIFYISHESGLNAEDKIIPYRAQIQARAAENKVFIVHSNAPANPDATGSHGQSRIILPDGNILQEASIFKEEVLFAQLDLTKAQRGFALNSLLRGPLQEWWKEGISKVQIIE